MTILEFAAKAFPDSSRTSLRDWISVGRFVINERAIKDSRALLQVGDAVQFVSKPPAFKGEPFSILFEDDDLVVVDKPSGLLSVARDTGEEESVHSHLKDRYRKSVYVVHRLDQETSGLILFARTYDAYVKLKEELKERKMKRCYEAILEGQLEGKGIWQCYLKEEGSFRVLASDNPYPSYEYAVTAYKVLKSSQRYTRVECQLQTGKKHQIRVHAQRAGCPVAGDERYGSEREVPRLCLHAKELTFTHPRSGKVMTLKSPTPPLFDKMVAYRKQRAYAPKPQKVSE